MMVLWTKARIPPKTEQHVGTKIENCADKCQKLKKKKKYCTSKTQSQSKKKNESKFLKELENLFDIANQKCHANDDNRGR